MSAKELEILSLFGAIEQGNRAAFDKLFLLYHARLLKLALNYVNSKEDAEDITSELFVKIWQKQGQLSKISNPEVYLFASIKNASLNYFRFEKRRKTVFTSSVVDEVADHLAVSNQSGRELFLLLDHAVAKLPKQRRIIFTLIKEEGLKSKAVAEIMDISVRTVENQLYKAVKSLADTLSKYLGYHPQAKKRNNNTSGWMRLLFLIWVSSSVIGCVFTINA